MSDMKKIMIDHDNPEWTDADFAAAKKGDDIPEAIRKAFPKKGPGRPAGHTKEQVTLRLDKDLLAHFRAGGPGWQSRVNEALRKAVN